MKWSMNMFFLVKITFHNSISKLVSQNSINGLIFQNLIYYLILRNQKYWKKCSYPSSYASTKVQSKQSPIKNRNKQTIRKLTNKFAQCFWFLMVLIKWKDLPIVKIHDTVATLILSEIWSNECKVRKRK